MKIFFNKGYQIHNVISSSGSDFLTIYSSDSGSGSTSQKVTVPAVPVPVPVPQRWLTQRKTKKKRQHADGRGWGWRRSKIIVCYLFVSILRRESMVLYTSFNTLCSRQSAIYD